MNTVQIRWDTRMIRRDIDMILLMIRLDTQYTHILAYGVKLTSIAVPKNKIKKKINFHIHNFR